MILASSGFPHQRYCIKCSLTLTGMFVVFLNVDDSHWLGVLVFGCVAIDVMGDPGKLGVSTPALLCKV